MTKMLKIPKLIVTFSCNGRKVSKCFFKGLDKNDFGPICQVFLPSKKCNLTYRHHFTNILTFSYNGFILYMG